MSDTHATHGSINKHGNGLVAKSHLYMLATDAGIPLLLRNLRGCTYSNAPIDQWNAIKAMQHKDGFLVLYEGKRKKERQFNWISVNANVRINGHASWQAANKSATQMWELILRDVTQSGRTALQSAARNS